MKINDAGLALIKRFEGCSLSAYRDVVGVLTIGYGDTDGVIEGQTITQEEADARLEHRVEEFARAIANIIKYTTSSNEMAALVSLAYNIGLKNFRSSSVLVFHNRGEKLAAANSFLLWNKAGGKTWPGLVRRREAERELYLTPDYVPPAA